MANLARYTAPLFDLDTFYIFDDFFMDQTDLTWIDVATGTGTATVGDAANGVMALVNSAAANDELYLGSANESFLVAAGKPLYFRARLQFAEANTDDAAVVAGFADGVAADLIVDGGTGLKTTGNYFVIFKVKDETVWRAACRNGTAVDNDVSSVTANSAAGTYNVLEVIVNDFSATEVSVVYKVNGAFLLKTDGTPIKHRRLIASSTEMKAVVGIKNGAAFAETLNVDYIYAHRLR
jgi:hypothetical protein